MKNRLKIILLTLIIISFSGNADNNKNEMYNVNLKDKMESKKINFKPDNYLSGANVGLLDTAFDCLSKYSVPYTTKTGKRYSVIINNENKKYLSCIDAKSNKELIVDLSNFEIIDVNVQGQKYKLSFIADIHNSQMTLLHKLHYGISHSLISGVFEPGD